ncbi:taste receptor type 2 member 8-like [Astyanax mexicanus]|uniref:Taste receptor type 2 n=1 Tax=Astyanax mexicanus TaxID=7994 RepID=A0A8T2LHP1_ASTMX|nr:taste receptor type 2 member 8-like [Astyanax mexicanus]
MDSNNTSPFSVKITSCVFASVNVPVSVSCLLLNIFYYFCLIVPQKGTEILKQPLKALLGSLLRCNVFIHISILVMVIISIVVYTMMISVNSSHWLNIFYCFQIIPVQHPYFIWLKKNIRVFIYSFLIINIAVCLLGMNGSIGYILIFFADVNITDWTTVTRFIVSDEAAFCIKLGLYMLSFCVMLGSSCVTVVFLWRHIKNMEKNIGSCSSPQRQRNIKLTIACISVQAFLHIICSALVIIDELLVFLLISDFDLNRNILCTVISLYSFATTINLGLSQSVFRQRAVHFHLKWCCYIYIMTSSYDVFVTP